MLSKINLKAAIPVTLLVMAALVVAKEVYRVPAPLLVFLGGMYAVCSAIFWSFGFMHNGPAFKQVVGLLLGWSLVSAALLGAVYRSDKAGWMWFKLTGYNVTLAENLSERVNVSTVDFMARYPFFSIDAQDSAKILLPGGAHDIDETVVIPSGLAVTIAPGAVLRFGVGCSLISYSPITARGTAEVPIIFTAQNQWRKWGVIAVVRASKSFFEYTRFEYGRQAFINEINLPATLSFHAAEAEVRHCEFVNLEGKDGANVNGGWVVFQDNKFHGCFKDGIDFDGGKGEISHNEFVNCGDEAIDLDEDSQVQVFDNSIVNAKDAPKNAANQPDMKRAENNVLP